MTATSHPRSPWLDYDQHATTYARLRHTHPGVLQSIVAVGHLGPESHVLDVGCGTGNYARALHEVTACQMSGIDPSAGMLEEAREAAPWVSLAQGSAEQLPFDDASFDLVMSTDVIHHVGDRDAFYREGARVLRDGAQLVTVTDSHDDIPRRRPLSSHFPETVAVERRRYPPVPRLLEEMARAGFSQFRVAEVAHQYELTDIQAYHERAFSSLTMIEEEAYQRGIARLEEELSRGPIPCLSLYTLIWGLAPRAIGLA
jgi:ubiquinone/menaquinone biosynthesis C-methylase UbiE